MADVVGNVAYLVSAEFDDDAMRRVNSNIAQGAARGRDEMGRFVREHRTYAENMMRDLGDIFSSGTSKAATIIGRNMMTAADQAGTGFFTRLGAAMRSIPGSLGTALSSGMIAMATSAMRSAGTHASEIFAERVRTSVPYWKSAFSQSFTQAAGPAVTDLVRDTGSRLSGLGDAFTHAGINASAKLGAALGTVAQRAAPALNELTLRASEAMGRVVEVAQRGAERAAEMIGAGLQRAGDVMVPIISGAVDKASSVLQTGMQKAGEMGQKFLEMPFRQKLGVGLGVIFAAAVVAGGAKMTIEATKLGVRAAQGIMNAITAGIRGIGNILGAGLKAAGSAIASAARALGQGAAQAFGDALKLGASMAGTAIAGILGTSLTKGFGRLTAIDNAEASLRGLAATANHVPEIMEAATNAVTGTAFGLDQAATAAAQFAAANVPIKDMERHLGALANAAAGAGGDFDGMADIFAKVAARGNVTGEVLNQLTSRGISGLNALADYLGKTTEEVQAMVSAGEISFDDFSRAMDAAMGQAAIEQATTFQGLMMNVGAAMGRFGAVMQKPFFDATKAALPGVINLFNQLRDIMIPVADIIAERLIPFAERLGKAMESVKFGPMTLGASELFGSLAALAPVLGAVSATFLGPLLTQIPVLGGLFSGLTGPVGLLAGALIALFAVKPETLMAGMETLLNSLPGMVESIVGTVTSAVPEMVSRIAQSAPVLVEGFASMFLMAVQGIAEVLPTIATAAVEIVTVLLDALIGAAPQLLEAGLSFLSALADGVLQAIPVLIDAIPGLIASFMSAITSMIPMLISAGVEILLALIDGIVEAIPQLVAMIPGIIIALVTALTEALPALIEGGVQIILGLILGIVEAIPSIIEAITAIVPVIVEALIGALPLLVQGAIQLFLGIVLGIVQALPQIITAVMNMLPAIMNALMGMIPELVKAGIQLVVGLITGIIGALPQIWEAILELGSSIVRTVKDFFGISSPSKLFEGFGTDIIQGLINGIEALIGAVTAVLQNIADIFTRVWDGIKNFVSDTIKNIRNVVETVINTIRNIWNNVWNSIRDTFSTVMTTIGNLGTNMADGVRKTFDRVISFLKDIPGKIKGFFAGIGNWLKDSGRALVDGFLNGIKNAWNTLTGWVSDGLQAIRDLFPFSPAKRGPFSGSGWVDRSGESLGSTFIISTVDALDAGVVDVTRSLEHVSAQFRDRSLGEGISDALARGLLDGRSDVQRATQRLAETISEELDPAMNLVAGFPNAMRLSSLDGVSQFTPRFTPREAAAPAPIDSSRHVTIEPGAIQVVGSDPKRTSLDVLDRIVEEL